MADGPGRSSGRATLAVLAALHQEAAVLADDLLQATISAPALRLWTGRLEGEPTVLVMTGVGKVAAALAAQFVCDVHRPRYLLSIGLAGATESQSERGQLIIASGAVQHDMDARPLTSSLGAVAGLGLTRFPADPEFSGRLERAAESVVKRKQIIRKGVVLTGDQIVTSREVRDRLAAEFPDGACFDMETAAVAYVAHQNHVPWGAVRITSDAADENFDLDSVLGFGTSTAADLFDGIVRQVLIGFSIAQP